MKNIKENSATQEEISEIQRQLGMTANDPNMILMTADHTASLVEFLEKIDKERAIENE